MKPGKSLALFFLVFALGIAIGFFFNDFQSTGFTAFSREEAVEEVFFCPEDNCASKLIQRFDSAQDSIHIAIYSFTLDSLSNALIRASARGVDVKVVFDAGQAESSYSEDEKLRDAGIPVRYAGGSGLMHDKFAVIDSGLAATGSFNYSRNANTKNDENLVFLHSAGSVELFEAEFQELWVSSNQNP